MPQATLIFNPQAGGAGGVEAEALLEALRAAGYAVRYRPTPEEAALEEALAAPGQVVFAAGGDGTLRAVARRLLGRGVALAPIPLGTANNLARALGVEGAWPDLLPRFAAPRRGVLDVWSLEGGFGQEVFLEGAGTGLFAEALKAYDPEQGKSPLRALGAALEAWRGRAAYPLRLLLDGEALEGRFLLLEALNTPHLGPRLPLAPGAEPGDGALDLLLLGEGEAGFWERLRGLLEGGLEGLPELERRRVQRLRVEGAPGPWHADGVVLEGEGPVEIALRDRLPLLLPGPAPEGGEGAG